jgi:hypothetical protein
MCDVDIEVSVGNVGKFAGLCSASALCYLNLSGLLQRVGAHLSSHVHDVTSGWLLPRGLPD